MVLTVNNYYIRVMQDISIVSCVCNENDVKYSKLCHHAQAGDMKNAYTILIGKPEGQAPIGKYICT
jgi:hypothetical protein